MDCSEGGSDVPLTLGELLGLHRKARRLSLRDIQKRARSLRHLPKQMGRSMGYFSNLEAGRTQPRPEWLEHLAEVYEIDGLLLMFNLPEPVSEAVQLDIDVDFKDAPWTDPKTRGTAYSIASFRLANSDLALVFLTLQSGGRSRPGHSHPGDEVVKVESGEAVMLFPHLPRAQRERHLRGPVASLRRVA
jgi:transcriptional regulator with XRE-family HTH domain